MLAKRSMNYSNFFVAGALLLTLFSFKGSVEKYDAFYPAELWKDNNGVHINAHGGGILYHEGLYYWYGEHKIAGTEGNKAHVGVHVYTSKDLYNWTDEGIALSVDGENTKSDIAKGCILERPKVIYNKKTGKFVMWFHLELKGMRYSAARSGVAVADSPTGPFTFIKSLRPNKGKWAVNAKDFHKQGVLAASTVTRGSLHGIRDYQKIDSLNVMGRDFEGGQMARDMNLFVDDDGKAYHIFSSEENTTTHIAELSDDYLSHTGKYVRCFVGMYMEAPTLFKTSKGKYYFIGSGCSGWKPNAARSAVADDLFGPWKRLGNPCVGENAKTTFDTQSTYVLPVQGKKDTFIFMADRWTPKNAIDGRYIWLPIYFEGEKPKIKWLDKWSM